jgi:hypothetical protein
MAAIHIRFGLPPECAPRLETFIKRCDRAAAYLEATQLAGFTVEEAVRFFGRPKGLEGEGTQRYLHLKPLAPNDASALYRRTFAKLA